MKSEDLKSSNYLTLQRICDILKKTRFSKKVEELFANSKKIINKEFSQSQIKGMPKPVQRYFKYALEEKQPYISFVRLFHTGELKVKNKWRKVKGEEYFTIEKPGFIWRGKLRFFTGTDSYYIGKGNLQIKLLGKIKIVDDKSEEIYKSELLRWLSEAPWYPTALLPSKELTWEEIDDKSAKAILSDSGLKVEGIFHFNDEGQIIKFEAERYKDQSLEEWIGYYKDYRVVNKMKVPFYVEVGWNLETGFDKYVRFQIEKIQYDIPYKFGLNNKNIRK